MQTLFEYEELLEVTNLTNQDATSIDFSKREAAIDLTANEIDAYLMQRYVLPLVNPPQHILNSLKSINADLARDRLDATSEVVRIKRDRAIALLKTIVASGVAGLTISTTVSPFSEITYEVEHEPFWTPDLVARLF